jgi:hypothetical protein
MKIDQKNINLKRDKIQYFFICKKKIYNFKIL